MNIHERVTLTEREAFNKKIIVFLLNSSVASATLTQWPHLLLSLNVLVGKKKK